VLATLQQMVHQPMLNRDMAAHLAAWRPSSRPVAEKVLKELAAFTRGVVLSLWPTDVSSLCILDWLARLLGQDDETSCADNERFGRVLQPRSSLRVHKQPLGRPVSPLLARVKALNARMSLKALNDIATMIMLHHRLMVDYDAPRFICFVEANGYFG